MPKLALSRVVLAATASLMLACDGDSSVTPTLITADGRDVDLVNLETGERRRIADSDALPGQAMAPAVGVFRSPRRTRTLVNNLRGSLIFDEHGQRVATFAGDWPTSAHFVGWVDEERLALRILADGNPSTLVLSDATGTRKQTVAELPAHVAQLTLAPNGRRLALTTSLSADGTAAAPVTTAFFDTHTGKRLATVTAAPEAGWADVTWRPDGSFIFREPGRVTVYGWNGERPVATSTRSLPDAVWIRGGWGPSDFLVSELFRDAAGVTSHGPLMLLSATDAAPRPFWLTGVAKTSFAVSPAGDGVAFDSTVGLEHATLDGRERRVLLPGLGGVRIWW